MDKRDSGVRGIGQELVHRQTDGEAALISRRRFLRWSAGAGVLPFVGCGHRAVRGGGVPVVSSVTSSLKAAGAAHGLLVGCAVDTRALRADTAYAALVAEQASIVVAENAMKWGALHPARDTYDFEQADSLVAFAEGHRIKVRGHNLCWHRYVPEWVMRLSPGAQAKGVFVEHIERVAGRYAGRMHSWDVVNEAIEVKDGRADGMRVSPWLSLVGDDYIEVAFRAARAADPQALLTYNEYGIEGEDEASYRKRRAVLMLLRRLKARNVPVDAMGVQSHLSAGDASYGPGLRGFLKDMRELDLQVFLTEMDVNDRALPADVAVRDKAVAGVYGRYLDLVLADPAVTAVLTWGITDRYTWLNHEGSRKDQLSERALPFDVDYRGKEAFDATIDAIDRRPKAGARG
ncbi:Endo-1,4-beta-xylanase A precursor [Granulicella sibirica]|uniref:Beta-xylanase n=2 Tax=Granulicella sibirica TaxID=2479048 RepID=A0A4Q0SZF4_9BACT|nr:Endo-1,4-beta-xylanase A precursor [Granulicella sibirica]